MQSSDEPRWVIQHQRIAESAHIHKYGNLIQMRHNDVDGFVTVIIQYSRITLAMQVRGAEKMNGRKNRYQKIICMRLLPIG